MEGLSAADVAAVTGGNGGRNNDGMFDNGWWIIILLLALGGRGFGYGGGGGFGGGGASAVCATPADVNSAVDRQTFISKLDGLTYGVTDATYALNNAITSGFAAAELSRANMAADNAKCCCEIQAAIQNGFCTTNNSINNAARDIIENQNATGRAILDFLVKDKIDTLTAENQTLRFQASQTAQNAFITANQEAQTAELIRRLGRDNPVPAYVVPNPNCCYQYNVQPVCGCGCGNNAF